MADCIHRHLSKLADTVYQGFTSFKEGFRFYRCEDCGVTLIAKPAEIKVVHPKEEWSGCCC